MKSCLFNFPQNKRRRQVLVLPLILFLLYSCGGGSSYEEADSSGAYTGESGFSSARAKAYGETSSEYEESGFNGAAPAETPAPDAIAEDIGDAEFVQAAEKSRKLIKTATVEITVDAAFVDKDGKIWGAVNEVDKLIKQYDAYVEQSAMYESSLLYTIKVPQRSYEAMLTGFSVLGEIVSRNETAEDVTLKYYDLAGRLATRETLLQTLQGYLGRAQSIEDIMTVETRISEIQNEIDRLGAQLKGLSNLTDYATIQASMYGPGLQNRDTLGSKLRALLDNFGGFASGFLVVILGVIMYGVPVIVAVLLAFWLFFGKIGLLRRAFSLASESPDNKARLHDLLGNDKTKTGAENETKKEK
ncbi:MAG: DUF4349 domain-containing protein [Treponema sp.]|jgi:hypothetical protein|nr:DUF4349 domain-containing protein [Treponema sp.]